MEKNVIVKVVGESDLGGLQNDLDALRDRESDIKRQMMATQAEFAKRRALVQQDIQGREKQIEAIEKLHQAEKKEQDTLQAELVETKSSIEDYARKLSQINDKIADGAVKTPKFTTQLRQMKDQLAKLEDEGVSPLDKGFVKLAVEAAKMEDQIGDTRQRISHLASDTKNLDAAMSLGQGLAGGFTVATSAAALLGGESEELQKAFFKAQAALSILNGVQQVANVLNKDSVANVVIGTAVEEANTMARIKNSAAKSAGVVISKLDTAAEKGNVVAKIASTVAQKALNAAMNANPAGIILTAILALGGAFMFFSKRADSTKKAQERLNLTLEQTQIKIDNIKSKGNFDIEIAKASGKSSKAVREMALSIARDAESVASSSLIMVRSAYAVGNATKEQYEKATQAYQDAVMNYTDVFRKGLIEEATERKQAGDKAKEAEKQAKKELQDVLIAQMQEGQFKEIEQIKVNYERRIAEIKGKSESEKKLRIQLKQLMNREIQEVEIKYAQESSVKAKELEILKAKNAATGSTESFVLKKAVLQRESELEILSINQSKDNEETKSEKIKAIRLKLSADLEEIDRDMYEQSFDRLRLENDKRISEERYAAEMILANNKSTWKQKQEAREQLALSDELALDAERSDLDIRFKKGLITQEQYEQSLFDLKEQYRQLDLEKMREKADLEKELQQAVYDFGVQLMQMAFDFRKEKLQQEMEDLDHYYTTDAEEAKNNSDKKLITEQALAQKKLEIKRKQAQVEKNEALFQIAINTAQAVMASLAKTPLPAGLPFMLMNLGIGAIQAGMVASKPLPKYAKGRKGGKGEFAMVGELGPEVMYVPDGASIVPHGKKLTPDVLEMYGIPKLTHIDRNVTEYIKQDKGIEIDYQKLGKAVADNIKYPEYPAQRPVTVNVDDRGVTVRDGNAKTTFLNKKYKGEW